MEIGIDDDIDFIEEDVTPEEEEEITTTIEEPPSLEETESSLEKDDDWVSSLLKTKGINDKSKITFENDEGETEEVDWDSLDTRTKLNILSTENDNGLDEAEILLINHIRQSLLTPAEYIQYVLQDTVNRYLQNEQTSVYKVDEYSDDELFVSDFTARTGVTEDEAFEALDRAKANETLFKKQMEAMRKEYQQAEQEIIQQKELEALEVAQAQYTQFAEGVRDEIAYFTEFAGCDLNMDNEDMQELYDFITGFDPAGNSYFGKALNDPQTLVRMAWFALNGEQMIQDINDYYKKEIANVRKESYNKGLLAAKDKPNVIYKNKLPKSNNTFDDLDDF